MNRNTEISALILLLYTVSPAAAQPADSPWPMFHHDLNHTGVSTYYGPDTLAVKWIFSTGDKIYGSTVIGDNGTVYIGTHGRQSITTGSKLFAIYPNGTRKWEWNTGHFIDSTPAVAQDGTLYVGCWDKSLYAVHPNGTVKWEFSDPGGSFVYTSPAIAPDGTVYIGNDNNRLYAIKPDGTLKWSYKTNGAIRSSPTVGADGTVYIGSHDKKLYAINPDGTLKWKYQTGSWIESSPAIGADGTIYVGSYDTKLHALNPDGTPKWKYPAGGRIKSSPAIGADGTIYVGSSYDKKLHAINPDGTPKWDYTADSYILSSPAIDADGTIYVGSFDRNLYAINPDGSLLWKYNTGDRIYYSSPAIASDGTIYIGNWDGYVYAFGPGIQSNRPPVLDQIGDRAVDENSLLEFTVNAADPDGNVLAYSASNLPDGAVFNPNTRTFSWTPAFDQAGTYPDVHFEIDDGEFTDWENISIRVNRTNRPPVLDHIGDRYVNENSLLEFTVNATDLDGDALTYSAFNLPDGAVFSLITKIFLWTPAFNQTGTYPDIHFEVSDGELGDWENITISVNRTNRPPVLDQIGDRTVNENNLLEFTVNATDPDNDILAYSASNLPDGAAFNPHTRTFSWTPTFDQAGTYPDVHFEVSDGGSTDWVNITITVNNMNRPPVLDRIGNRTIDENCSLEFTVNASDPDGDALTFSASNLPDGAVFNPTMQTFSWTPTLEQAGTYPDVHFEISDGELTDLENITIRVIDADASPKITVITPDSEVLFQQQFTVNITVDPMNTEIYGIQYILSFDNSVLHAEWQNEGTFLNSDGADTNMYINTIDNGAGMISFAATRVDVANGVTDPGTLAVIKFTAIQKGVCSDLTLDGVIVADENGNEINPAVIINSSICVDENQPPLAAGKSMHRYNNEGEKYLCRVYFDGAGSSDPDGEILYWRWGFGDGNYGTGELIDHIYHSWKWNGTGYDPFTAVLTVTDDGDPHQLDDTTSFDVIVYTAGDANGDGRVNILDATIVGLEWGATTTCEAYCWEGDERADKADLNNDCNVNILDAVIIGTCWGHTAW